METGHWTHCWHAFIAHEMKRAIAWTFSSYKIVILLLLTHNGIQFSTTDQLGHSTLLCLYMCWYSSACRYKSNWVSSRSHKSLLNRLLSKIVGHALSHSVNGVTSEQCPNVPDCSIELWTVAIQKKPKQRIGNINKTSREVNNSILNFKTKASSAYSVKS